MSVIMDDLRLTRSVEITIENILDGRLVAPPSRRFREEVTGSTPVTSASPPPLPSPPPDTNEQNHPASDRYFIFNICGAVINLLCVADIDMFISYFLQPCN